MAESTTEAKPAAQDNPARGYTEQVIVSEKFCALLEIPADARVLDVGTGNGHSALQAAVAAARRRAKVTAIHLKEPMLEHARRRAEVEGVAGVEFIHADAAAMPFPDASFDYVVSTLGAVFLPDQEAAAKELARVLRPGGVLALTAFSHQSLPSQVYDLGAQLFPNAPRPQRHHYEWCGGPRAGELLNPYFHSVRVQLDHFDSCYPSAKAALEATSRSNPNVQAMMSRSSPELVAEFTSRYLAIAESFNRATNGTLICRTQYGIITGVRAG